MPSRTRPTLRSKIAIVLCVAVTVAGLASAHAEPRETIKRHDLKLRNQAGRPSNTNKKSTNGISYHGGPVITGTVNVYSIWYGNWAGNSAPAIVADFAAHLGGSAYFNINTTYYNGSNVHVSNAIAYAGETTDAYSRGAALSDSDVFAVVSAAITSGRLPSDSRGVYMLMGSADVNLTSGYGTQYCGWHTHGSIGGVDIKYVATINSDRAPSACEMQTSSPNGNAGADGMINILAHEIEEAATDPDLNAWFDTRGYENADKCAWTFGATYSAPNGTLANVKMGTRDYLIQRNWVNASGGYCSMTY